MAVAVALADAVEDAVMVGAVASAPAPALVRDDPNCKRGPQEKKIRVIRVTVITLLQIIPEIFPVGGETPNIFPMRNTTNDSIVTIPVI
jgi:hypothetical protein